MLLADLGADVVKVEPPEGDSTRGWGPPWQTEPGPESAGTAAYYLAANRNKRSIRLDLSQPIGREVLRRLLTSADVLVENFRTGAFARLGFDDEELARLNPSLVHLAITGFGTTGPLATTPGYDFLIQAQAGLMSITGFPDDEGGQPAKVGVAVSDLATGLFGAVGVLSALIARDRTGLAGGGQGGQRVDVSIFESTLALLINQAQNLFVSGHSPGRRGNAHPNIVPYETFATSDGQLAVGAGSERQWRRLCEALDDPGLAEDERFATNGDRVRNRTDLRAILAARFAAGTTEAWLARLEVADVPSAPINDIAAAFAEPQAIARSVVVDLDHPTLGRIRQVAPPIGLSSTPASVRLPPPALGEHSHEILVELGYNPAQIESLRERGVV
jgi:crotonobetainyl-CoA:carnitine CoA-transferase CaiB-like acyl-CoA transferase